VSESGKPLSQSAGVAIIVSGGEGFKIEAGSGSYSFAYEYASQKTPALS
jgi:hypothetical protein